MSFSPIKVSIIIPAYNAASTISQTINSLLVQTSSNWEAIVIDDGSTDDTAAIITSFAATDSRIRLVSQLNKGVSAARNKGISLAKYDWLLFLDSDDWITDNYLEQMTVVLAADADLDAVVCGGKFVNEDGTFGHAVFSPPATDMFPYLVHYCPFFIHSCIIRKQLVVSTGMFDIALTVCEEWDLWQRIARTGARFGAVKEVLTFYRMRPNSLSRNRLNLFENGLTVISRGYSRDDRVPEPHPDYVNGIHGEELFIQKIYFTCWCAGLFIGQKEDAKFLLNYIKNWMVSLDYKQVANSIFDSVWRIACKLPQDIYKYFGEIDEYLWDFLNELEDLSKTGGLAQNTITQLEREALAYAQIEEPVTFGSTYAIRLEITKPIADIYPPPHLQRLVLIVVMEGTELGKIELPICDGFVPAWLLKDAIAAQYAWQIIGRFFEYTIYQKEYILEFGYEHNSLSAIHDQVGWRVFLQQLWERSDWPVNRFYDANYNDEKDTKVLNYSSLPKIEISKELPNIKVAAPEIKVIITVGGIALGVILLQAKNNFVSAQNLRTAINTVYGFELCSVCVREALIGCPLNERISLRERLAQAGLQATTSTGLQNLSTPSLITSKTLVLGRRNGPTGGNAFRRAVLPSAATRELIDMANVADEPILHLPPEGEQPDRVLYVPEGITSQYVTPFSTESNQHLKRKETSVFGRQHFETLFSKQPNPWKYTHPYELTKYEFTLSLLPDYPIKAALEIACAEGHFTEQLAPRVEKLTAVDISQVALDRAAERCRYLNNISFQHLDLIEDNLPGKFDLIVCSEVLYFVGDLEKLKAIARKFADALNPEGYLLMAHAHQIIDEPDKPGFDWGFSFGAKVIGKTFASIPSLQLRKEIRTPLYRVQLFERQKPKIFQWIRKGKPEIKLVDQPTPVPPAVESSVRWHGGKPSSAIDQKSVVTDRLPILMYHRVAPMGAASLSRYRVIPEQFEEQLQYLRDCGYYSVNWSEWLQAMTMRKALPGRAMAITFDDGYLDFYQYAWPLLNKYGFTATVFLVVDRIGHVNSWDEAYGEEVPLMGWGEIFQLRQQGVEFGSHSYTHASMTALTPTEIVREGVKSRMTLQQKLNLAMSLFAYPHGYTDPVVAHLIGACGYSLGFSCRPGSSTFRDDMLMLPRIEVCGSDSLQDFVAKLS